MYHGVMKVYIGVGLHPNIRRMENVPNDLLN